MVTGFHSSRIRAKKAGTWIPWVFSGKAEDHFPGFLMRWKDSGFRITAAGLDP